MNPTTEQVREAFEKWSVDYDYATNSPFAIWQAACQWHASALSQQAAEPAWRCFHCDEVFADQEQAALHFGTTQMQKPACQFDVAELRDMEALMRRYQEEDTDLHREIYRLNSAHHSALQREEEKGYARGLRDAAPPAVQQQAAQPEGKELQLAKIEVAGLESSVGHLSQRVDEAVALAEEAIELMTRFHSHAEPDDSPDMNAVFPALHFRNFVDDHARLMYKLAQFKRDQVDPALMRLKKAADEVCAVLGHHGEISARDDRVQVLMDCLYATDPLESVYAQSTTQPVSSAQGEREAFERWASDPVRSEKLPLERWPNGAYKDTRAYLVFFGWQAAKSAALLAKKEQQ